MHSKESTLIFEEVTEADIPELAAVSTRAFDDVTQKYLGKERGGPAGYDNGEFFRTWFCGCQGSIAYKIIAQGKVIGGFRVWVFEHGENRLGTIFVDPAYQDRGVGTRTWQFIEAAYPDAKSWTLKAMAFAVNAHHYYEAKCGFTKIGEEESQVPGWKVFIYKKEMEQSPGSSS